MGIFDIFNASKIKEENQSLHLKIKALEDSLQETKGLELADIKALIQQEEQKREEIKKQIIQQEQIENELTLKIKQLNEKLLDVESDVEVMQSGLYRPRYNFATSLQYKDRLDKNRKEQKQMISNKTAVNFSYDWHVNGSKKEGRKMIDGQIKVILRCFNAECEAAINKIKFTNLESIKKKINNSYDVLNKAFSVNNVSLSSKFLHLKFDELYIGYEYELKKEEEREALREQREKEREEKALQKEIDNKKKKIDKELTHLQNLISELQSKLAEAASTDEKNAIQKQIEEAELSVSTYTDEQKELDYRLENTGAGYVYIISNIGAFGEGVVKIGVTRRLDPLERINELSSASVPFKFDVHALIFSYNAYKLEAELHKYFEKNRVNKVNNRKEFFKISFNDLENKLREYKDLTIEFNSIPDAEEYRQSIASENLKKA